MSGSDNDLTGMEAPGDTEVAETGAAVDLGLVLAVDCSSSIDAGDFQIQLQGIAAALRHPMVAKAIAAGEHRRIALSLVLWSNAASQQIALPWRLLASDADLELAARQVAATPRDLPPGGTGLAAAIDFSTALLAVLPVPAKRKVIDVSGDGEDNEGGSAAAARNGAVARGITVNGLPIVDGSTYIVDYYRTQVIGGTDSFLEPTQNIMSFQDTILRKLLREIGRPVA